MVSPELWHQMLTCTVDTIESRKHIKATMIWPYQAGIHKRNKTKKELHLHKGRKHKGKLKFKNMIIQVRT